MTAVAGPGLQVCGVWSVGMEVRLLGSMGYSEVQSLGSQSDAGRGNLDSRV